MERGNAMTLLTACDPIPFCNRWGDLTRPDGTKATIADVQKECERRLEEEIELTGAEFAWEYFSGPHPRYGGPFSPHDTWEDMWKETRRLAVLAVTGDNEGFYVHVDMLKDGGKIENLFLVKHTGSQEEAIWIAGRLTQLLHA